MNFVYAAKFVRWAGEQSRAGFEPFGDTLELYLHLVRAERLDEPIEYLEFCVAGGWTFAWWIENNVNPASRFVGFDTFTGLPEDWGPLKRGEFSTQGKLPLVGDSRARFEVGLFQDTLGPFLRKGTLRHRKVIHLDADLYSSTSPY